MTLNKKYFKSKSDKELIDGIEVLNNHIDEWMRRICKRLKIEYTPEFKQEVLSLISKSNQLREYQTEENYRLLKRSSQKLDFIQKSEMIQNVL